MKRRDFSKYMLSTGLFGLPILCNSCTLSSYDDPALAATMDADNRVLVLIQLKGGNDGLNSLIPLNQFDLYQELRPTIGLQKSQLTSLDTTLSTEKEIGLHPSLLDLKDLYDSGLTTIIQSVSYPNVDRSHFKSTDLWLTGGDGTAENNNIKTGWMGRFLQNTYPELLEYSEKFKDPLGIQIGNTNASLGFHIEGSHKCSVNISGQDPAGYYTNITEMGGVLPSAFSNSLMGEELKYISQVQNSTSKYAKRISSMFNKGKNYVDYPDTDLSNQLKTVARLLHGGLKTKIFMVQLSDFDTHKDQVLDGNPIAGEHSDLLKELGGAVKAFINDIQKAEIGKDVITMTFSEFGRKAKENGDLGTDHGKMAPMFIFGSGLKNGVIGDNLDLSTVDEEGQLSTEQIDYREIYATVLQDWFGASNQLLDASMLNFYSNKVPVISDKYQINPSNYIKKG